LQNYSVESLSNIKINNIKKVMDLLTNMGDSEELGSLISPYLSSSLASYNQSSPVGTTILTSPPFSLPSLISSLSCSTIPAFDQTFISTLSAYALDSIISVYIRSHTEISFNSNISNSSKEPMFVVPSNSQYLLRLSVNGCVDEVFFFFLFFH
jgi:hypothetical protein